MIKLFQQFYALCIGSYLRKKNILHHLLIFWGPFAQILLVLQNSEHFCTLLKKKRPHDLQLFFACQITKMVSVVERKDQNELCKIYLTCIDIFMYIEGYGFFLIIIISMSCSFLFFFLFPSLLLQYTIKCIIVVI